MSVKRTTTNVGRRRGVSRREFLRSSMAAGALTVVSRQVLGGEGRIGPNDRTTLAGIGMGGQGIQNIAVLMK